MLSCSTHGRVPSAFRTRVGQPTAQVIPGTWRVTSDEAALDFPAPSPGGDGVLGARAFSDLPQPGKPTARAASARADRKSLRMDDLTPGMQKTPAAMSRRRLQTRRRAR